MLPSPDVRAPSNEAEFVGIIASFLTREGYRVWLEVSNMGQSADLVARRNRWFTVIEAKLKDWRTAIKQCQAHEMVADFVCVAYCSVEIPNLLTDEVARRGYGLLHYSKADQVLRWVVQPKLNPNVWLPQRQTFISSIRSINHVD